MHLETATFYPRKRGSKPEVVVEKSATPENPHAAIVAFYESIRTGKQPPTGVKVGALAAMTSILGREAIYRGKMLSWEELGVEI